MQLQTQKTLHSSTSTDKARFTCVQIWTMHQALEGLADTLKTLQDTTILTDWKMETGRYNRNLCTEVGTDEGAVH